jgi:putative polyhydroxyalkanoate system protein
MRPIQPETDWIGHGAACGFCGIIAKHGLALAHNLNTRIKEREMSKIDIRREHGKSLKAAKAAVDKTAAAIGKKFGINSAWDGDTLNFERAGGHGQIQVTKTEVRVTAELGFLMSALKPMIETEIKTQLDKNFG